MRGQYRQQSSMFSYLSPEQRVRQDHPLRAIRTMADQALSNMSERFDAMYAQTGRPSIPPEKLLRAQLIQMLYSVRSERLLMEEIDYSVLFRWFVGMNLDEPVWDVTVFTKNRDRLLDGDVAREFLVEVVSQAREKNLTSDEHFTVDGTLIEAWASLKSFHRKDEKNEPPDDPGNPTVDFHGEKRSNDTHESTTDPDALLARKGSGKEAKLSYNGNLLMENRNGLIVTTEVFQANGTAERDAALVMLEQIPGGHRVTVGADKAYDTKDFVAECRNMKVTPHVAQNTKRTGGYMDEFLVYYDDQCEVCQAGVSWLRFRDRRHLVRPIALSSATLPAGLMLEDCLRELHVITSNQTLVGWDAVARLARLFGRTWIIGAIGGVPPFSWLGGTLYRYVARNRYAVSRCRGGACGSAKPAEVRTHAGLGAFWTCRSAGLVWRLPLVLGAWVLSLGRNLRAYVRTFRRRLTLLDGRLTLLFIGSPLADWVPLIFGERFWAVFYDDLAIDPGSSKMRNALRRHLDAQSLTIHTVTATHHHEEHSGNLEWLSSRLNADLLLAPKTSERLRSLRVPWMRRLIIGQPAPPTVPAKPLGVQVVTTRSELQVIPTPGHSDDHVSFYDPRFKLLFAGDSFMGRYFSSPNPDVDSLIWIQTLERLLDVGVEILVEGHGHIHTLSREIPDIPDVVIRQAPEAELKAKLDFFQWIRRQVMAGQAEGMPASAIAATCFPWGQRWTWERFGSDLAARVLSSGEFSRVELVRSFQRPPGGEIMPEVYEMVSNIEPRSSTCNGKTEE